MPPPPLPAPGGHDPESELIADPRLQQAISLFNAGEWYACHDGLEELWHETAGPLRPVLQGLLQIAVAHLHLERGNGRGATVLLGEGLGRLRGCDPSALGLDLARLQSLSRDRLEALQQGLAVEDLPLPRLNPSPTPET